MNVTNSFRRSGVLAVGVAAVLGFSAAPAHADVTIQGSCSSGYICMWEDEDYSGSKYIDHNKSWGTSVEIDWWDGDNEISSFKNYTGCKLILWSNDNFGGSSRTFGSSTQTYSNLETTGFDNNAESFELVC